MGAGRGIKIALVAALVAVAVVIAVVLPGSKGSTRRSAPTTARSPAAAATTVRLPVATVATAAAPRTTTTNLDPGALPQTMQLPSGTDPTFRARITALVRAVVDGDPAEASGSFFPLSAYIQVKGISDPVHDYQTRLIPDFDQDIMTLHSSLVGSNGTAVLMTVDIPDTAQWILPGVEYNKDSYWRVYGTTVSYSVGGTVHTLTIASMISWRGEWYVVHLNSIR